MMLTYTSLACVFLAFATISFSIIDPKARNFLRSQFLLRVRTNSQTQTPSRPVSSTKDNSDGHSSADYTGLFPPFRRKALADLYDQLPAALKTKTVSELVEDPPEHRKHVPLTTPSEELMGDEYTPTGFTVEEIRQLGDFPDYATLSGVPLPLKKNNFDITKALPRPYRPFRWAYHQTMALSKLETDYWLELDRDYTARIAQRRDLYARHGKRILQYLPGAELAVKELMEHAVQFLCARYPRHFSLDAVQTTLRNNILGTTTDLTATHPLHVLLHNVPEDFAVMLRDPVDGRYCFRAGVLCSAQGWTVDTKIGKRLHEIHEAVPDYRDKMQMSMDRYFAKKPTDKCIQRGSWSFEVDTPLFMPPGDPHALHRETQSPSLALSRIHLRVDWQTLRRLPLTGAIVFNFKALFTPVTKFREEAYVPALALKVLKEGKKDIMEYKATWHTEHVVGPALEEWVREQEAQGVVEKGWEVRTLDEAPFFPGWEGAWKREQGF